MPETKSSLFVPSVQVVSASVIVQVLFPAAESFLIVKVKASPPAPAEASTNSTLKFFKLKPVTPAKDKVFASVDVHEKL